MSLCWSIDFIRPFGGVNSPANPPDRVIKSRWTSTGHLRPPHDAPVAGVRVQCSGCASPVARGAGRRRRPGGICKNLPLVRFRFYVNPAATRPGPATYASATAVALAALPHGRRADCGCPAWPSEPSTVMTPTPMVCANVCWLVSLIVFRSVAPSPCDWQRRDAGGTCRRRAQRGLRVIASISSPSCPMTATLSCSPVTSTRVVVRAPPTTW